MFTLIHGGRERVLEERVFFGCTTSMKSPIQLGRAWENLEIGHFHLATSIFLLIHECRDVISGKEAVFGCTTSIFPLIHGCCAESSLGRATPEPLYGELPQNPFMGNYPRTLLLGKPIAVPGMESCRQAWRNAPPWGTLPGIGAGKSPPGPARRRGFSRQAPARRRGFSGKNAWRPQGKTKARLNRQPGL